MADAKHRVSARAAAREARENWERAADVWEDLVHTGKDWTRDLVHAPPLMRALGPVRGLRVLDLGCGTGYFSRVVARKGAKVTGVDWSEGMLGLARRREQEEPLGVQYRRLDAARIGRAFPRGSFDRVVACMSLMDMPDPARTIRGASRVLRPNGRLAVSISHPVNTAPTGGWAHPDATDRGPWLLDHYFEEGPHRFRWRMPRLKRPFTAIHWHHTLTSWMQMITDAGLYVAWMVEPRPTARVAAAHAGGSHRIPFWIVFDCRPLRSISV